ncbi:MAG: hypothetical protein GY847_29285 [Proteobacteria bacterium]|nr:hypothetical protein [Pseudomonadota bacterium]
MVEKKYQMVDKNSMIGRQTTFNHLVDRRVSITDRGIFGTWEVSLLVCSRLKKGAYGMKSKTTGFETRAYFISSYEKWRMQNNEAKSEKVSRAPEGSAGSGTVDRCAYN